MYGVAGHHALSGARFLCLAVVSTIALSACGATQSARSAATDSDRSTRAASTASPMASQEDETQTRTKRIGGFPANFYGSTRVEKGTPVKIDAGDDYFDPTVLTGSGGSRVTLVVTNSGEAIHSFTSDELQIDEDIEIGKSIKIAMTLPRNGRVVFICRYHEYGGMVGALESR